MKIYGWFWLLLASILGSAYFLFIKYLNTSQEWIYLTVIIGVEFLTLYSYYNAFNYTSVGIGYGIIKAIAIILVAIGGIVFFSEKLKISNIIGIIILVIGIIVVSL